MKNARRLLSLLFVALAVLVCSVSPTGSEALDSAAVLGSPNPPPPVDPGGDN